MTWLTRRLAQFYDPFQAYSPGAPPRALGAFLVWALGGMRGVLIALAVASCLIGLTEVMILAGLGGLVDRAQASGDAGFWAENAGYLIWLAALALVIRPLAIVAQAGLTSVVVTPGLNPAVIWRLNRHALRQSLRYFEDDFAGRLAQKAMQSGQAVMSVTIDVINSIGLVLSFLVGMTIALMSVDWRLGLFALAWAAAYGAILRWTLPGIRRAAKIRAEKRASATGRVVDSYTNIKTVQLFAGEAQEDAAARAALSEYRAAGVAVGAAILRLRIALAVLNGVALTALGGFALALWDTGAAGIGAVAAALALMVRLTAMSNWVAFTALGVFNEIGVLEDGIQTLATPHDLTDPPAPAAAPPAPAAILFDDVAFRYGREAGGIERVRLKIAPGEKVGLVGPSGAGKSTLVALLLRLYDAEAGAVRIGGTDVRALPLAELRRRIGVVAQEGAIFNRSVFENIRYGRPDADLASAAAAAERAEADAFIRDLQDGAGRTGYEAHLGERGVKLSGGQRQRIALARVILKDAPVLVLDEATAALDSEVEAAILDAMSGLMEGKTVIAIAHRLSTIARMDRIVVLDQGRIVEEGSHAELIAAKGLYAQLWARQSGGFLGVDQRTARAALAEPAA